MKKIKIALIGTNGQLGTDLSKTLLSETQFSTFPLTHQDIEITNQKNLFKTINKINPDFVINTAAFHKLDEVEKNPNKAFLVNSIACYYLANYCKEKKKTLVFISTDYVFGLDKSRSKPYKETDHPGPVNTYGVTKLAGENFIRFINPKYMIIRTSGLFGTAGSSGKGGNFVETMLKLAQQKSQIKVVNDQIVSPTYTIDLARQITYLVGKGKFGLFHATSEGKCSWYEFAKEIFRLTNYKVNLKAVSSSEFPTKAQRPSYSVLGNYQLKKENINKMHHWKVSLKDYLKKKGHL